MTLNGKALRRGQHSSHTCNLRYGPQLTTIPLIYLAKALTLAGKMHVQTHTHGTHTGRQALSFMNGITAFVNQIARTALRLVLIAAVSVFLFSLLFATLIVMLTVTVWALVTGRKPDPAKVFGQFRQTSARYTRGAWPSGSGAGSRPQDIVDVPAHEIRDAPAAPDSHSGNPPPQGKDPMARVLH